MASDADTYLDAATASIADERYGGDGQRGFAHVAFQLAYPTFTFSDDQAEEATSIDRKGDLGADALVIAADEKRILIYQSKSSTDLGETELHDSVATFLKVPDKLFSDEWVEKAHSEMKSLANDFRMAVRNGYELHLAFATLSPISETVRSTYPASDVMSLADREVDAVALLLDAEELEARYRKLLLDEYGPPTDVRFSFARNQLHEPDSAEDVAYVTLEAREFAAECKPHGVELFRFNPRLYLGPGKRVNREIAQTLRDPNQRCYFHLLNNGVTAVCRGFELVDAGDDKLVMEVQDFQVVNGCQTTMTLIENSAAFEDDDRCLVDVKIIKSEGLRNLISEATNTQTAIVAEDSFANEPEQKHISTSLDRLDPPYFYAPKRGMWERLSSAQKKRYFDPDSPFGRHRKVTSKELAAVFLAVFGEPEAAKDRPKVVFQKVDGSNSVDYTRIFEARNVAVQWVLPFELFRCANAQARLEAAKDPDGTRARIGQYGRFRMAHLCYGYLATRASEPAGECMSATTSKAYLESITTWGPGLTELALDALVDAFEDAQTRGESSGLREFFREKKHQKLVSERFAKVIRNEERSASRDGERLRDRLKLPT